MRRLFLSCFFAIPALVACDNGYLYLESKEELVVEGWIEDGHAPFVMVSSSLPVSSDPRPLEEIEDHILRYAEVYVEHNGERVCLTACLSDRITVRNYFTSSTLRGKSGDSYTLHVKWRDFEASSTCTIPEPTPIDTVWFEKERDDSSYVLKMRFHNNPEEGKFYKSFRRIGSADTAVFTSVNFFNLKGSQLSETVEASYMKPVSGLEDDTYFHTGDIVAVKLSCMEESMYDFWSSYTDASNGSGFSTFRTSSNLKGNVEGALGYWAGYGSSVKETVCP